MLITAPHWVIPSRRVAMTLTPKRRHAKWVSCCQWRDGGNKGEWPVMMSFVSKTEKGADLLLYYPIEQRALYEVLSIASIYDTLTDSSETMKQNAFVTRITRHAFCMMSSAMDHWSSVLNDCKFCFEWIPQNGFPAKSHVSLRAVIYFFACT